MLSMPGAASGRHFGHRRRRHRQESQDQKSDSEPHWREKVDQCRGLAGFLARKGGSVLRISRFFGAKWWISFADYVASFLAGKDGSVLQIM
jgi:hypothetical protein